MMVQFHLGQLVIMKFFLYKSTNSVYKTKWAIFKLTNSVGESYVGDVVKTNELSWDNYKGFRPYKHDCVEILLRNPNDILKEIL